MQETESGQLNLFNGLEQFAKVYMPARNFPIRTREEYQSDLTDLAEFLAGRNITNWGVVGLRVLQHFMAELDRKSWPSHPETARPTLSRPSSILSINPTTS